jgi:E3 ubiquitin-protein ligase DRIP
LPAKRKQRSISSLVVDTPSVVKQTGLTGKRTKAKRRAAASLATSPVNNGTMKLPSKSENGDQKTDKSCPSQSTKAATSANKTENQDQKKTKKISAKQSTRAATPAKKKQVNVKNHLTFVTSQFDVKVLYGFSCKNGLFSHHYAAKQRNTDAQVSSKPSSEKRKNSKTADKDGLRKSSKVPRSTPKIHAVNEEQIKEKEGEPPTRKGEADNKVVIPGTSVREHSNNSNLKEKNDGTSPEPSPLKDKTATEDDSYRGSLGSAKGLHGPVTTPVWFSLISLPNQ